MADLPKNIGWIGLGIMGLPMAKNIIEKTSNDTQLFVYDVVQDSIDKLVNDGKGRVHVCGSSKEVADKSVRFMINAITTSLNADKVHRTSSSPWSPKAATSAQYT